MELKELEILKTDIVSGVSAVFQKKYDEQVAGLHTELKQTNDAIQKMRMGAFGRVDAQDKAEMDHAVCNYFMHDILRLDGVVGLLQLGMQAGHLFIVLLLDNSGHAAYDVRFEDLKLFQFHS